jgi:hypothetical protein
MKFRVILCGSALAALIAVVQLDGATVSKQQADLFTRKVALIAQQGDAATPATQPRRTPISEGEVNSWFAFNAKPLLPAGVSDPQVTIVGQGKVGAQAVVDLDVISKKRSSGGLLDPWSFLGGRVPVSVLGTLHTENGRGRFEMEAAEVSGVPLPSSLLQELVTYYSRTPDNPQGVRIDNAFALPANIKQIEVGQGQAVIVQ